MQQVFINRKAELKKLINGLTKRNYILIAPRRFGKTVLAKRVLNEIKQDKKYRVMHLDLMIYSGGSVASVAEGILEKLLNLLGVSGKLRKLWNRLDFKINIKARFSDLELEFLLPLLKSNDTEDGYKMLETSLELIEKIAKRENIHICLFCDEFSELSNLGERVINIFRSVIQHHEHVTYLFAGSQESTMNAIFLDKAGAFYRFGEIIYLKELEKKDIVEYINKNFPNIGKLTNEAFQIIDTLLETLDGHPYYTAQAIAFFEENPECTYEEFNQFLTIDLFNREAAYITLQQQKIKEKKHALDVLRILAMGLKPNEEIKLFTKQNLSKILHYLEDFGYIHSSKEHYKLTDPLLRMYLAFN